MAISYVASSEVSVNSSGWTVAEPAGSAAGHVILGTGFQYGASRTITPPSPFTLVGKTEYTGWGSFTFVAIRGASAVGTSWSSTTDDGMSFRLMTYSGVDTGSPVIERQVSDGSFPSTGTVTWTAVTTTGNSMVVGAVSTTIHSGPTSSSWDNQRGITLQDHFNFDEIVVAAGSSGTFTAGFSAAGSPNWYAQTIALREAASRTQEGFRWRADDGSETTATWLAAQDANP